MKKYLVLFLTIICMLMLVACGGGGGGEEVNPKEPKAISLKVKIAKVQINNELSITYTITPATAQDDAIKVSLSNDLATFKLSGTNKIILTAGGEAGTIKVNVETSNGIKASKTIKIQVEEVESYPDLSGYTIKIGQAESALGEYDPRMTQETADKYGYYGGQDREFKIQAMEEIEENYNCSISVEAYPSDAPWGPARWNYILSQAQNESPEFDFYVVESSTIPGFVAGNAIHDLTDWYAAYGQNIMNDMAISNSSYKQRLYGICTGDIKVEAIIGYNYNLFLELQKQDPSLVEPAQMFLDDNWNYDTFKAFIEKCQTILNTMGTEDDKYYALSGYGSYWWRGLVNAAGIKVLDSTQLVANITGTTETLAATMLQELYAEGCTDPAQQVDGGVVTWNNGHALFNTGGFWFLNHNDRWRKDLWGENTSYGWVPYPTAPGCEHTFTGTSADGFIVMASCRDWAYEGFGEECNAENIYRAFIEYHVLTKKYYTSSEDYDYEEDLKALAMSKFGSEASVKAYMQVIRGKEQPDGSFVGGLNELGFYEPFSTGNTIVDAYGGAGTFGGDINEFIKGNTSQWIDAVGSYQSTLEKGLVDAFG